MRKIERIQRLYYKCCNFYKQHFLYHRLVSDSEIKALLDRNLRFKNIHKGHRCFILGNGPSLNDEDLSCLEKEYVFTVNQIARHKDFKKVNSNYHFWADPVFFKVDNNKPGDMEMLESMRMVNMDGNVPQCFFPIEQVGFIKQYNLDNDISANYFATGLQTYEGFDETIDYTKFVPEFGTVVMWCITMAVYMGFSEIYLLGCDTTGIITTINSALNNIDNSTYAYQVTENEKSRLKDILNKVPLTICIEAQLNTLLQYDRLYKYCKNRGIKLVNCSSKTIIESVPRMRLNDVLEEGKL